MPDVTPAVKAHSAWPRRLIETRVARRHFEAPSWRTRRGHAASLRRAVLLDDPTGIGSAHSAWPRRLIETALLFEPWSEDGRRTRRGHAASLRHPVKLARLPAPLGALGVATPPH